MVITPRSLQPPPGRAITCPGKGQGPAGQGPRSPGTAAGCGMKRLLVLLALLQLLGEYGQGPAAVG